MLDLFIFTLYLPHSRLRSTSLSLTFCLVSKTGQYSLIKKKRNWQTFHYCPKVASFFRLSVSPNSWQDFYVTEHRNRSYYIRSSTLIFFFETYFDDTSHWKKNDSHNQSLCCYVMIITSVEKSNHVSVCVCVV